MTLSRAKVVSCSEKRHEGARGFSIEAAGVVLFVPYPADLDVTDLGLDVELPGGRLVPARGIRQADFAVLAGACDALAHVILSPKGERRG